jgi:hypothetical protein
MHGMGARAPRAAAVAAATTGFARLLHVPKGGTFMNGTLSMIVAAGSGPSGRPAGSTLSAEGDVPKLHFIMAPMQHS